MCLDFSQFLWVLHHFILAKLATSNIRVDINLIMENCISDEVESTAICWIQRAYSISVMMIIGHKSIMFFLNNLYRFRTNEQNMIFLNVISMNKTNTSADS